MIDSSTTVVALGHLGLVIPRQDWETFFCGLVRWGFLVLAEEAHPLSFRFHESMGCVSPPRLPALVTQSVQENQTCQGVGCRIYVQVKWHSSVADVIMANDPLIGTYWEKDSSSSWIPVGFIWIQSCPICQSHQQAVIHGPTHDGSLRTPRTAPSGLFH